jgi:hypothetical protein
MLVVLSDQDKFKSIGLYYLLIQSLLLSLAVIALSYSNPNLTICLVLLSVDSVGIHSEISPKRVVNYKENLDVSNHLGCRKR